MNNLKNIEKTMLKLWNFLKNYAVKIYLRVIGDTTIK